MNDDEVEFEPDSAAAVISRHIAVSKVISVSYGALMLHSRIRNGDELVAVFVKRIFAEPVFKSLQHSRNFPELPHRGFLLMRQNPILNIQIAAQALEFFFP